MEQTQWAKVWFEPKDGSGLPHTFIGRVQWSRDKRELYIGTEGSIPAHRIIEVRDMEAPNTVKEVIR